VNALDLLKQLISPVLVAAALIGYDQIVRPHPEPYQPPLAAAAKQYRDTLPDAYHKAAEQVRAAVLTDKADVVEALQAHAKPLATALDTTFSSLLDDKGKIANAPAAAEVLEQTSQALKGK
jgi:hypothetical protein